MTLNLKLTFCIFTAYFTDNQTMKNKNLFLLIVALISFISLELKSKENENSLSQKKSKDVIINFVDGGAHFHTAQIQLIGLVVVQ